MIDLLREQLFQQQLCITRDVSYDGDDLDLLVQSPDSDVTSVSKSEQAVSEFSHQISYLRDTITRTQLQQQEDLSKSFSDVSTSTDFSKKKKKRKSKYMTVECIKIHDCGMHQENVSAKCIPSHTPLLYSKTGVCRGIPISLIFAPKHRLWVLFRTTSRGGSKVYPQSML